MAKTFGNFIVNRWVERLCDVIDEDTIICFFRINTELQDGTIFFEDFDLEGQPYTVQSAPVDIQCCDGINIARSLQSVETNMTAGDTLTYGSNSIHSISIYVVSGTADINGTTLPTGVVRNVGGDSDKNNLLTVQTIDNVTGSTFVTMTQYV